MKLDRSSVSLISLAIMIIGFITIITRIRIPAIGSSFITLLYMVGIVLVIIGVLITLRSVMKNS